MPAIARTFVGVRAAFSRSLSILRTEGFRSLWIRILGEILYRRMEVFEKKTSPASTSAELPEGLEVCLLSADEVDEFLRFRALHPAESILERLEQGQVCFLVRHNGVIIHSTWITTGHARIGYLGCDFMFAPGVAYVFEAYTPPSWRRKSISSVRKAMMEKYCFERGYNCLLAIVWPENRPAYRNVQKAGYERVGRTGYIGMGRFRKHFFRYQGDDPPFRFAAPFDHRNRTSRVPVSGPAPHDNEKET